jgi:hypothetical protein
MRKLFEPFEAFLNQPDSLFIMAGAEGGTESTASIHLSIRHARAGTHPLGLNPEDTGIKQSLWTILTGVEFGW